MMLGEIKMSTQDCPCYWSSNSDCDLYDQQDHGVVGILCKYLGSLKLGSAAQLKRHNVIIP
jgi:hypothetical protein